MKGLKDDDIVVVGEPAAMAMAQILQSFEDRGDCGEWEMKTTPEGVFMFIAPDDMTPELSNELKFKMHMIMDKVGIPQQKHTL